VRKLAGSRRIVVSGAVVLLLALAACGASPRSEAHRSTTGTCSQSACTPTTAIPTDTPPLKPTEPTAVPPTPQPTCTPATPPSFTLAWVEPAGYVPPTYTQQVWASVNGGTTHQVTHLPYNPPSGAQIASGLEIGQLALAPDAGHIAFSAGYAYPDTYDIYGSVFVASLSGGSAVAVPNSSADVGNRSYAWISNTELALGTSGGVAIYDTGTALTRALPNTPHIDATNGSYVADTRVRSGSTS
jgi:hypothetical protein